MKLIKKFKDFSILESESSEMGYRTFFLVPVGTESNYCYMEFELTPITTSMPEMAGSEPGECRSEHFDDDSGVWITENSVGYGKIFVVTFFLPMNQDIEVHERSASNDETIEDIIAELKNHEKGIVSLYHLKNPDKEDGGYDYEDEYDFDLIGAMVEEAKSNFRDVAISLIGTSDSIKNDFIEALGESDVNINTSFVDLSIIRKNIPGVFNIIMDRIKDTSDAGADLGELGF